MKQRQVIKLRLRNWRTSITSADQFFKSKVVKIHRKVLEKVAFERIIAVAKNYFIFKMLFVVFQLIFYVSKSRIKLIVFSFLRIYENFICYGAFFPLAPQTSTDTLRCLF